MLKREGRSVFQCGREVTGKEISEIKETDGTDCNHMRAFGVVYSLWWL